MKLTGKLNAIYGFLILSSCATSFLEGNPIVKGPLVGMIYDLDRKSVAAAEIKIYLPGVEAPKVTQTDINGRFSLPEAPYGPLKVVISKELFEPLPLEFTFTTQSQVLYAQIIHRNSLVDMASQAFGKGEWEKSAGYVSRAKALDKDYPDITLLEVYLAVHEKKIEQAKSLLEGLIDRQPGQYGAWVALADLYEYHFKDVQKAVEALRKALDIRYNPHWEERIKELEKL